MLCFIFSFHPKAFRKKRFFSMEERVGGGIGKGGVRGVYMGPIVNVKVSLLSHCVIVVVVMKK